MNSPNTGIKGTAQIVPHSSGQTNGHWRKRIRAEWKLWQIC